MTTICRVFDESAGDYDQWFDDHGEVYVEQVRFPRDEGGEKPRNKMQNKRIPAGRDPVRFLSSFRRVLSACSARRRKFR